jgi:hypothetical protein
MTVMNEQKSSRKYTYLYYVEFLEFLCRIALNLDKSGYMNSMTPKTVDIKVFNLLEIIYSYRTDNNLWQFESYELYNGENDSDED